MNDLKDDFGNYKHGGEGYDIGGGEGITHYACNERIKREGGTAQCCECVPCQYCKKIKLSGNEDNKSITKSENFEKRFAKLEEISQKAKKIMKSKNQKLLKELEDK